MRKTLFCIFTVHWFTDLKKKKLASLYKQTQGTFLPAFFTEFSGRRWTFTVPSNLWCFLAFPNTLDFEARWPSKVIKVPVFYLSGVLGRFLSKLSCHLSARENQAELSGKEATFLIPSFWRLSEFVDLAPSPELCRGHYLPLHLDSLRGHHHFLICLPLQQSSSWNSWQHLARPNEQNVIPRW